MVTSGNLLETGLAKGLANPGGNVTGLSLMAPDLNGKRLEILKETLPQLKSVAALWAPRSSGYAETEAAAKALSLRLRSLQVRSAEDLARLSVK